jgi:hypothetical protein
MRLLVLLPWTCLIGIFSCFQAPPASAHEPLRAHPQNPYILEFRGQPTVLRTFAEHYSSIINRNFDFVPYLDVLKRDEMNLTRVFLLGFRLDKSVTATARSPLSPDGAQFLQPWQRVTTQGNALDGLGKWDFNTWNEEYFTRLESFLQASSDRGIVVQLSFFCAFYDDLAFWRASPFNPANNVQGAGPTNRHDSHRIVNATLFAAQEAAVRRIVRVANRFDHVYFEIQNEPFWNEATVKDAQEVEFHNRMLAIIREEESSLPNRHMVSHNWPQQIDNLSNDFDVINEHYPAVIVAPAPDPKIAGAEALLANHYFRKKVLALDETNTLTPAQTRLESWMFLLGGGGIYNGLDIPLFIYTDTDEAGDSDLGRAFREPVRNIGKYMDNLHLVALRRDLSWVTSGIPEGATLQAMASPGQQYVAYLHHGRSGGPFQLFYDPIDTSDHSAVLVVNLDAGAWKAVWTRPADGVVLRTEEFTHQGGSYTLAPVVYQEDVALRIDRTGEGDATPPPAPSSFVPSARPDGSIQLSWKPSQAEDVAFYHLYRSDEPNVIIEESHRIAILPAGETAYPDPTATVGTTYYYTVTAVDQNTNESGPSIEVSATSFLANLPFGGSPIRIPAVIQAEDFDLGGQNIAYNDLTPANEGGLYRNSEAVDLELTSDTDGGHDITGTAAGEWLEYSFSVAETETFILNLRVSSAFEGSRIFFEIDGRDVTGLINIPAASGSDTWQTLSIPDIAITAGEHLLRMTVATTDSEPSAGRINWVSFAVMPRIGPEANAGTDITITDQDLSGSENVTLDASATRPGNHPIASYHWSKAGVLLGSGSSPTFDLSIGQHLIELKATDSNGLQDIDEILVTVTSRGFVNGSFENDFQGWTTSGNLTIQTSAPYAATDGRKLVAFNSAERTPNAVLSQAFATTAGKTYQIQFDAGVLSYNGNSQTLQLNVIGNGNLLSRTITINGSGGGSNRWIPQTYTFVANQLSTTISFQDRSTTTSGLDMVLDQIRLTELTSVPVPAPQALADAYNTDQATTLSVPVAGIMTNDINFSSLPLAASLITGTSNGALTLNPNGSFIYTPQASFVGTDTFTYRVTSGNLISNIATVTLTINAVIVGPPAPTSLVNGSFEAGFTGWTTSRNVSLQGAMPYRPTDGTRLAAFNSSNSAPNGAILQSFATNPGQIYTITFDAGVLAYNTDPQRIQFTVEGSSILVSQIITIQGLGNGQNRWLPQRFTFVANSQSTTIGFQDQSASTTAIDLLLDNVRVTATGSVANTAPVAVDDSYATVRNLPLTIPSAGLLSNDTDEQLNLITASIQTQATNGTVILDQNGGFTYTPTQDYSGPDSFTYRANDGRLDSNVATVRISVNVIPSGIQIMPLGDSITFGSTGSNAGYRGELYNRLRPIVPDFRFVGSSREGPGSLPGQPIDQRFHEGHSSYTLLNVFNNLDGFDNSTFLLFGEPDRNPNGGHWLTGGNGTGRPPLFPDIITMMMGTTEVGNLTGVQSRLESLITKITTLRPATKLIAARIIPSQSQFRANVDTYNTMLSNVVNNFRASGRNVHLADMNTGFPSNGLHPDGVHPNDIGFNWMAARWLEAIIAAHSPLPEVVNTAPTAIVDSYSTNQNTELVVPDSGVLANDRDAESNPLNAVIVDPPSNGVLVLNPSGGFIYTPRSDFSGLDFFRYQANDGRLNSETITVNITVNAVVVGALKNGSFEADFTDWVITGNLSIQTPPLYSPTQGSRLAAFNTGNSTPNASLSQSFATIIGQTYTVAFDAGVLSYNTNPQTLQVSVTGTGNLLTRTISINGNGGGTNHWVPQSFTFVADNTSAMIRFRDLSTSTAALDLMLDNVRISQAVNAPNTAPEAVADRFAGTMNTQLDVPAPGVLQNDTDAQNNPLRAVIETGARVGSVVLNPDGGFVYTPAPNHVGSDSFTYRAMDATLSSAITTVTIQVNEAVIGALANGGFESGFSGWTTSGNIDIRSATPYVAREGSQLVAFNTNQRTPNGLLTQAFPTNSGQNYTLRFEMGVLAYNTDQQILQVTATGTNELLSRTITINGLGGGAIRWAPQVFTFVANSSATTLRFRDISTTSNALDLLLDDVRVEGQPILTTPPAPPTAPLSFRATAPAAPIPSPTVSGAPGNLIISIIAPSSGLYTLQSSTNLIDWKQVAQSHYETSDVVEFSEALLPPMDRPTDGKRFFRVGVPVD